jgi:hypothetical protein
MSDVYYKHGQHLVFDLIDDSIIAGPYPQIVCIHYDLGGGRTSIHFKSIYGFLDASKLLGLDALLEFRKFLASGYSELYLVRQELEIQIPLDPLPRNTLLIRVCEYAIYLRRIYPIFLFTLQTFEQSQIPYRDHSYRIFMPFYNKPLVPVNDSVDDPRKIVPSLRRL